MPDVHGRKMLSDHVPPGVWVFVPDNPDEWWRELKPYAVLVMSFTMPRNGKFFRKWWALVKLAFDNWECVQDYKGVAIQKNFETFRRQITILAGHYDVVASLTGEGVKKEARSISWSKMTEEEFTEFYERSVDAVLEFALRNYTKEDLDNLLREINGF